MRTLSLPLIFVLGGCFQTNSMVDVLPDERIQVNLPMDEGTAAKGEGDWSDWYLFTASTTENINTMIGAVLFWVDTITTDYRPTYLDRDTNQAEWGPWATALDPVETLLWVSYDPSSDVHSWGFDQWPRDAERDAATTVILGEVDPGATREISTGRFEVDFTSIHELDPTEPSTGLFTVDYDIHTEGVSATASFVDFGPERIDAEYAYEQTFDGDGMMDLVVHSDVNPGSGTGLEETWFTRSRWHADGSGRADIRVTDGDLGDETATISECWSASFEAVYYTESLGGTVEGDPSLCAFESPEYTP
jgi:hypothetical protein